MSEEIKLVWDGEKIKQSVTVEDQKYSAGDLLSSLEQARFQLHQFKDQIDKIDQSKKQLEKNIKSIEKFIDQRSEFEVKAREICMNKLKGYIDTLKSELVMKASTEAAKIIAQDPNAYTEQQTKNQKYVIYQKLLATHPKIAQNISPNMIKAHLYENPIFDNPFAE